MELDKLLEFYVETDLVHEIITIGKETERIDLTMTQAKSLLAELNRQIQLLSGT